MEFLSSAPHGCGRLIFRPVAGKSSKVKAAEAYLTVHSGSRSVGFKIAENHNPGSPFSHENLCEISDDHIHVELS